MYLMHLGPWSTRAKAKAHDDVVGRPSLVNQSLMSIDSETTLWTALRRSTKGPAPKQRIHGSRTVLDVWKGPGAPLLLFAMRQTDRSLQTVGDHNWSIRDDPTPPFLGSLL